MVRVPIFTKSTPSIGGEGARTGEEGTYAASRSLPRGRGSQRRSGYLRRSTKPVSFAFPSLSLRERGRGEGLSSLRWNLVLPRCALPVARRHTRNHGAPFRGLSQTTIPAAERSSGGRSRQAHHPPIPLAPGPNGGAVRFPRQRAGPVGTGNGLAVRRPGFPGEWRRN